MDPINIIVGIGLILSMAANSSTAKKSLKRSVSKAVIRPRTFLQRLPLNVSAVILILEIMALFQIGTLEYKGEYLPARIIGMLVFLIFSWLQVKAFKNLGASYSQEIVVLKEHKLITTGMQKIVRHPQYITQILSDLGVGIALLGFVIVPLVLFFEIPLFILRAKKEENILAEHFKTDYEEYKKRSGFMFPFIG